MSVYFMLVIQSAEDARNYLILFKTVKYFEWGDTECFPSHDGYQWSGKKVLNEPLYSYSYHFRVTGVDTGIMFFLTKPALKKG